MDRPIEIAKLFAYNFLRERALEGTVHYLVQNKPIIYREDRLSKR